MIEQHTYLIGYLLVRSKNWDICKYTRISKTLQTSVLWSVVKYFQGLDDDNEVD